jgi:hypothetical protein
VNKNFPILIVTGRPAAGKSELIDFLKKTDPGERSGRFHIGEFEELDDFPYVWETFEIDDIMTRSYGIFISSGLTLSTARRSRAIPRTMTGQRR